MPFPVPFPDPGDGQPREPVRDTDENEIIFDDGGEDEPLDGGNHETGLEDDEIAGGRLLESAQSETEVADAGDSQEEGDGLPPLDPKFRRAQEGIAELIEKRETALAEKRTGQTSLDAADQVGARAAAFIQEPQGSENKFELRRQLNEQSATYDRTVREESEGAPELVRQERELAILKALKAGHLIGSGRDSFIQQGEKALAELVRDDPSLIGDEKFRRIVSQGYVDMAGARRSMSLPEWQSGLKVEDIITPDSTRVDSAVLTTRIQEAMRAQERGGLQGSKRLFEESIRLAGIGHEQNVARTVELFIEGMKLDSRVGHLQVTEDPSSRTVRSERTRHRDQESAASRAAVQSAEFLMPIQVSLAFNKIGSGDPEMLKEGRQELLALQREHPELLESDPNLPANQQYAFLRTIAFRDHHMNKGKYAREQVADSEPDRRSETRPEATSEQPDETREASTPESGADSETRLAGSEPERFKPPSYEELFPEDSDFAKDDEITQLEAPEEEGSWTTTALIVGGSLALMALMRANRARQNRRIDRDYRNARMFLEPVSGEVKSQSGETRQIGPGDRVDARLERGELITIDEAGRTARGEVGADGRVQSEVIGTKDGKLVVRRAPGSPEGLADIIMRSLEGEPDRTTKKIDLDKKGIEFHYDGKNFVEENGRIYEKIGENRRALTEAAQQFEVLDRDAARERYGISFERPSQETLGEVVRAAREAVAAESIGPGERLGNLQRAVTMLGTIPHADREAVLQEIQRELKRVGVEVTYTNETGNPAKKGDLVLRMQITGSRSRLSFDAHENQSSLEALNRRGEVRRRGSSERPADQARALTAIEEAVDKSLASEEVRRELAPEAEGSRREQSKAAREAFLSSTPEALKTDTMRMQEAALERIRSKVSGQFGPDVTSEMRSAMTGERAFQATPETLAQLEQRLRDRASEGSANEQFRGAADEIRRIRVDLVERSGVVPGATLATADGVQPVTDVVNDRVVSMNDRVPVTREVGINLNVGDGKLLLDPQTRTGLNANYVELNGAVPPGSGQAGETSKYVLGLESNRVFEVVYDRETGRPMEMFETGERFQVQSWSEAAEKVTRTGSDTAGGVEPRSEVSTASENRTANRVNTGDRLRMTYEVRTVAGDRVVLTNNNPADRGGRGGYDPKLAGFMNAEVTDLDPKRFVNVNGPDSSRRYVLDTGTNRVLEVESNANGLPTNLKETGDLFRVVPVSEVAGAEPGKQVELNYEVRAIVGDAVVTTNPAARDTGGRSGYDPFVAGYMKSDGSNLDPQRFTDVPGPDSSKRYVLDATTSRVFEVESDNRGRPEYLRDTGETFRVMSAVEATAGIGDGGDSDTRLRSTGQEQGRVQTQTDIRINELAGQLDRPGLSAPERTAIETQIKELLVEQARQYARKMGLVVRDSQGRVTDYLIDPRQIELVRGRQSSSFDYDTKLQINIDQPRPTEHLWHEMRHQKDVYQLTVRRMASDMRGDGSFERAMQTEVFGEIQTGDQRLFISDGKFHVSQAREKFVPLMEAYQREFGTRGPLDSREVAKWLEGRPDAKFQHLTTSDVANILVQEMIDWRPAGEVAIQPRAELADNPQLKRPLGDILGEFSRGHSDPGKATIADIERFLESRDVRAFNDASISNADLARLMSRELAHYQIIMDSTTLTPEREGRTTDRSGSYADQLSRTLEAESPKLSTELNRQARRLADSGVDLAGSRQLRHLTRGIVEARLGIVDNAFNYSMTSPFERTAGIAENARQLSLLVEQAGQGDQGPARERIQFNRYAIEVTRALSDYRTAGDDASRRTAWEKARSSALKLAERLPNNWVGEQMADRLVELGLVRPAEVPDGFKWMYGLETGAAGESTTAMRSSPSMEPADILDRAAAQERLPAEDRPVYEKAVRDGILSPTDLANIFERVDQTNRETLIKPLLESGKLTATGASRLASMNTSQLDAFGALSGTTSSGAAKLEMYLSMVNSPELSSESVSRLLTMPEAQRLSYESLLAGGDKMPAEAVTEKILRMSPETVSDFNRIVEAQPESRGRLLNLVQLKGAGEAAFIARLSVPGSGLDANMGARILNRSVRHGDIAGSAERLARADRDLGLLTEMVQGMDRAEANKLLESIGSGATELSSMARFQEASRAGYVGGDGVRMADLLAESPANQRAMTELLAAELSAPGGERLGVEGFKRAYTNRNRISSALEKGLTTAQEIHSLLSGSPADMVAAEIVLQHNRSQTQLSRPTVEGLIQAARDGRITVSAMESIRQAALEGAITDRALQGMLGQPRQVFSELAGRFERLWTSRSTMHDSHLDRPTSQRTAEFIESDNRRFVERFVGQLETNPGDRATIELADARLEKMLVDKPLSAIEPALASEASRTSLRAPIGDAPTDVRRFADAMSRGNYNEAIRIAMADRSSLSNRFTPVEISFADLSNPGRLAETIATMDKIGFASGFEGRGQSGTVADLARPVVVLPNGTRVDLSGAEIRVMSGQPTPQETRFLEMLKENRSVQILRGRVALTAFEERMIHSGQGQGGAQSALVKEGFEGSREYQALEQHFKDRDPSLRREAMREIDVAARLIESGMSLNEVKQLLGDRHLSGEREFFYDWVQRQHPDRVESLPRTSDTAINRTGDGAQANTTAAEAARAERRVEFLQRVRSEGMSAEGLRELSRITPQTLDKLMRVEGERRSIYMEGLKRGLLTAEAAEMMFFEPMEQSGRQRQAEAVLQGMMADERSRYTADDVRRLVSDLAGGRDLADIEIRTGAGETGTRPLTERIAAVQDATLRGRLERVAAIENPKVRAFAENLVTLVENRQSIAEFERLLRRPHRIEAEINRLGRDMATRLEGLSLPVAGDAGGRSATVLTAAEMLTSSRHSQLEGLSVQGPRLADICLTVRTVGADGITHERPMRLIDVSGEMLADKLDRLDGKELERRIEQTRERQRKANDEGRTRDARKEAETLRGLQELHRLKAEYDTRFADFASHEARRTRIEFCESRLAEVKGGRRGLGEIVGKAGMVTGLLLLFNAFTPEAHAAPLDHERVAPGPGR